MSQKWVIPTHSVRVSKRARRVTIKVSAYTGLEVVIPIGFKKSKIPEILRSKEDWIEKSLSRIQPEDELTRPDSVQFDLLSEFWSVEYAGSTGDKAKLVEQDPNVLLITGSVDDPVKIAAVLNQWLQKRAKAMLIPWLGRLSEELSLPFNRVSVRRQLTKWGSCSGEKSISLNRNLLFVQPHLARYVLVHELCHCLRLDHSNRFWNILEKYEPKARQTAVIMRDGVDWVPRWAQV